MDVDRNAEWTFGDLESMFGGCCRCWSADVGLHVDVEARKSLSFHAPSFARAFVCTLASDLSVRMRIMTTISLQCQPHSQTFLDLDGDSESAVEISSLRVLDGNSPRALRF